MYGKEYDALGGASRTSPGQHLAMLIMTKVLVVLLIKFDIQLFRMIEWRCELTSRRMLKVSWRNSRRGRHSLDGKYEVVYEVFLLCYGLNSPCYLVLEAQVLEDYIQNFP